MNLSTPIEEIPRIGPQYQKKLKKMGMKTLADLLFHFPHRYEDFSKVVPISKIKIGESNTLQGRILDIKNTRTWKRRIILTQAIVEDNSGAIKVVWFNQPYLINVLKKGDLVSLSGKTTLNEDGLYLSCPVYEKIENQKIRMKNYDLTHTGRIVPIYPETEGLSSRWLRFILKPLLIQLKNVISDPLPEKILLKEKLLPISQALWQIHFPDSLFLAKKAKERFAFEELFLISLMVQSEKQKLAREKGIAISINLPLLKNFVKSLPFKLTKDQKKTSWQILKDLEKPRPMNRLLEGDVGSGKTVVATLAALNVAKAGYQIALMTPTEILAKQHFKTIWKLLKNFKIKVGLLTGKENKIYLKELKERAIKIPRHKLLQKVREGEIDILIGTQTLIQDRVKFGKLALVVLDEQHRFGVEQRARLCQRKADQEKLIPHLLSMTATPIPRTLALTLYGDLDLSLINQLPKGRKKIITKIIPPEDRQWAYNFIKKEVKKGRQAFIICPRIEPATKNFENEKTNEKKITNWTEVKTVKEEYEKLSKKIFPDLKIAQLHGKMKPKEKEKIMKDFRDKKIDILISTSVVEVGIDIPNATVIVIEGAEKFGLAQLHQFRGRVGRNKFQSFCFLFTDSSAKKTFQRLKALTTSESGLQLAEKDLEIRGPGDFLGHRQWGIPDLVMASLGNISLVEKARHSAKEILEENPELKKYPFLKEKLEEFRGKIHLE